MSGSMRSVEAPWHAMVLGACAGALSASSHAMVRNMHAGQLR